MLPDVADFPQNLFGTSDRYFTRFLTDAELIFNPLCTNFRFNAFILHGNWSSVVLLWLSRIRNVAPLSLSSLKQSCLWATGYLLTWQHDKKHAPLRLWRSECDTQNSFPREQTGATGDKQHWLSLRWPWDSRICSVKCSFGLILRQTRKAEAKRLISNTQNCRSHIIPSLGSPGPLPHSFNLLSLCKCSISTIPH